jgi:hypothetical protein
MEQLNTQVTSTSMRTRLTKKHYIIAFLLVSVPFLFGLYLFILNPTYISKMLLNSPTQPFGWIMTLLIIVLTGVAYPSLLGCFAIPKSERRILRLVLIICVILFLILPALILVWLGPAFLVIDETLF